MIFFPEAIKTPKQDKTLHHGSQAGQHHFPSKYSSCMRAYHRNRVQQCSRFLMLFNAISFWHGGYWMVKLVLDASSWMQISRPRPFCACRVGTGFYPILSSMISKPLEIRIQNHYLLHLATHCCSSCKQ